MPELPEVETVKTSLKKLIINKTIKNIDIYYPNIVKNVSIEEFKHQLINQTFREIKRRGKYLIFILDDIILVSHLRMEGKYLIKNSDEQKLKHEHIIFTFTSGETLRYHDTRKFGTMHVFKTTDLNETYQVHPLSKVGYEPFDQDLTVDYLFLRFKNISKPIKSTLLDQTIISGLGNIYVDEVCFMSSIHPTTPTKSLSRGQIETIICNSKIVLEKAIKLGGTTIRTFTSSHEVSGKFQNSLLVHTKKICPNCNHQIIKIVVGGRGTYVCENCQKKLDITT